MNFVPRPLSFVLAAAALAAAADPATIPAEVRDAIRMADATLAASTNGDWRARFELLPERYQSDLRRAAETLAEEAGPEFLGEAAGLFADTAEVFESRSYQSMLDFCTRDGNTKTVASILRRLSAFLASADAAAGRIDPLLDDPVLREGNGWFLGEWMFNDDASFGPFSFVDAVGEGEPAIRLALRMRRNGVETVRTNEFVRVDGKWIAAADRDLAERIVGTRLDETARRRYLSAIRILRAGKTMILSARNEHEFDEACVTLFFVVLYAKHEDWTEELVKAARTSTKALVDEYLRIPIVTGSEAAFDAPATTAPAAP